MGRCFDPLSIPAAGYATESTPNSGDWDTFTLINPVSITKYDADGRVTDDISAVRASTSGKLTAGDAIGLDPSRPSLPTPP